MFLLTDDGFYALDPEKTRTALERLGEAFARLCEFDDAVAVILRGVEFADSRKREKRMGVMYHRRHR